MAPIPTAKTVAVSIEPNFKAPKHTRKAFKKLVAQGEMKKYVKGSCAVENLYAKKFKYKWKYSQDQEFQTTMQAPIQMNMFKDLLLHIQWFAKERAL